MSFDVRLIAKEDDRYHIAFTVKDTGIGMTKEQVKSFFHHLSRVTSVSIAVLVVRA